MGNSASSSSLEENENGGENIQGNEVEINSVSSDDSGENLNNTRQPRATTATLKKSKRILSDTLKKRRSSLKNSVKKTKSVRRR